MNDSNGPATRVERIRAALTAALSPRQLEVIDDSQAHAGHAGALTGKGHFRVFVIADGFTGLAPIKRHRLVYAALADLMDSDIHALSIDARTPAEA